MCTEMYNDIEFSSNHWCSISPHSGRVIAKGMDCVGYNMKKVYGRRIERQLMVIYIFLTNNILLNCIWIAFTAMHYFIICINMSLQASYYYQLSFKKVLCGVWQINWNLNYKTMYIEKVRKLKTVTNMALQPYIYTVLWMLHNKVTNFLSIYCVM